MGIENDDTEIIKETNMDSRKRSLDASDVEDDDENISFVNIKKTNNNNNHVSLSSSSSSASSSSSSLFHLKVLVPSSAAGAIIGKGGETIAELQKKTGAKIKMSKSNDFYPGTTERVCLITGVSTGAVLKVSEFIADKIRQKPDPHARSAVDYDNKTTADRDKQIKILIPNSAAGMIIGKAGAFIKQLKDESGAFIQLSQKSKEAALQERVVTIIGEPENNKKALEMIFEKIAEDSQSGSCLNISYGDVQGLVANFNPTGSPFAHNSNSVRVKNYFASPLSSSVGGALSLRFNFDSATPASSDTIISQLDNHIGHMLSNSGYSDSATDEILKAIGVLVSHGVLSVGLSPENNEIPSHYNTNNNNNNNSNIGFAQRSFNGQDQETTTSPRYWGNGVNKNSFGLGTHDDTERLDIEINESIIGAIIGPSGRSIIDIQQFSDAKIQISKKGMYSPGTRNRIVSITGSPKGINTAKILIEKKIVEEESKRERNNSF